MALNCLSNWGIAKGIQAIKHIHSADAFYGIQHDLGEAAVAAGVPGIWFDDVWAEA